MTSLKSQTMTICNDRPLKAKGSKEAKSELSSLWEKFTPPAVCLIRGNNWINQKLSEKRNMKSPTNLEECQNLKEVASQIYNNELQLFKKVEDSSSNKEAKFRRHILKSGTAKDRIACHVLCLSEAPLHSLHHFYSIVTLLKEHKDSLVKEISKSLEDVISASLLPRCFVARQFEEHSFAPVLQRFVHTDRNKVYTQLLIWYFEDQLHHAYKQLALTLQEILKSNNQNTKQKVVQLIIKLLGNHPQQETDLMLQILVNKLGDLDKTVTSAVVYGSRPLLIRRQALKNKLVDFCADFLYRANQRKASQYTCMLLLKDILFSKSDVPLAQKLIKLYFGFFKASIKQGDVNSKLMSVILRGLNRALPFVSGQPSSSSTDFLTEQLDTFYRMAHLAHNFGIIVQLLQLLYYVHATVLPEGALTERFHRLLYSFLFSHDLSKSNSTAAFLNIVFKTMNRMDNPRTLKAFAKRLLQILAYQPTHIGAAILFILSELCVDNSLMPLVLEGKEETVHLMKEVQQSAEPKSLGPSMESVVDPLAQGRAQENADSDEASDNEYFEDLDIGLDGRPVLAREKTCGSDKTVHNEKSNCGIATNIDFGVAGVDIGIESGGMAVTTRLLRTSKRGCVKEEARVNKYDPLHRNPTYCGVQHSSLWELRNSLFHYHPSLAAFSRQLLNKESFNYAGDPLIDFSFMKFLDKFVFKNPKKIKPEKLEGGVKVLGAKSQYGGQQINVAASYFRKLKESDVAEDEKFFHKYFTTYKKRETKPKQTEVTDDEFEEYLKSADMMQQFQGDEEFDDQWDFAARAMDAKKNKASSKDDDSDEEESSDASEDENEDEEEFENDGQFECEDSEDISLSDAGSDFDGYDEGDGFVDGAEFDDDDYCDEELTSKPFSTKKRKNNGYQDLTEDLPFNKRMKSRSLESMIVYADEFDAMLQENERRPPAITSAGIVNTDKASVKQVKWEESRAAVIGHEKNGQKWSKKSFSSGKSKRVYKKTAPFKKSGSRRGNKFVGKKRK